MQHITFHDVTSLTMTEPVKINGDNGRTFYSCDLKITLKDQIEDREVAQSIGFFSDNPANFLKKGNNDG